MHGLFMCSLEEKYVKFALCYTCFRDQERYYGYRLSRFVEFRLMIGLVACHAEPRNYDVACPLSIEVS